MEDITYLSIGIDCPKCESTISKTEDPEGIFYDCENCGWSQYNFIDD